MSVFVGGLVAADVTVDAVTPIVKGITGVLVDATAKINLLVGAEADVILASADGTAQVTVGVLAQLIATLIVVGLDFCLRVHAVFNGLRLFRISLVLLVSFSILVALLLSAPSSLSSLLSGECLIFRRRRVYF